MRKILLLSLGFLPSVLIAQQSKNSASLKLATKNANISIPLKKFNDQSTPPSTAKSSNKSGAKSVTSTVGTIIGETYYDLQGGSALQRRVNHYTAGNKTSATWTFAPVADSAGGANGGFPHRGTGYNHFNGTSWGPIPTIRQEGGTTSATRTGWPALVVNANNEELIVTHQANPAGHYRRYNIKNGSIGSTSWTTNGPITSTDTTAIWTRTAASGNYVYMIDVSQNSSYTKSGCTTKRPLTYSRSTDGGTTWSTDHIIMPGFPCGRYNSGSTDEYFIDAKDSIVAVIIGGVGRDVTIFKSTDWGVTFNTMIADTFPVANFDGSQTIDVNQDNIADTVSCNDGNVTCLIDNFGKIHAWWGDVATCGTGTVGIVYFPGRSRSLHYWSEYGKQSTIIDDVLLKVFGHDCNNDNFFNNGTGYFITPGATGKSAVYDGGFIAQPQAGIDAAGNIYVVYSEVMDNDTTGNLNPMNSPGSQPYRDLFMAFLKPDIASQSYDSAFAVTTAGNTWSLPVNITKTAGFEDAFPSMARNVDTKAYITWQEDIEPGTALTDGDDVNLNYIKYMELDIAQFQSDALTNGNVCQTTLPAVPTAKFDTASNGCTWTFTDKSTNNPLAWNWSFTGVSPNSATTKNKVLTYTVGGTKNIQLQAINQTGAATKKMTIYVNAPGCKASGMDEVINNYDVTIYPNPTTGKLNVVVNEFNSNAATISITNMLGQEVAKLDNQTIVKGANFNFDLSNQSAGVYFIKFQSDKGNFTQKFVISK